MLDTFLEHLPCISNSKKYAQYSFRTHALVNQKSMVDTNQKSMPDTFLEKIKIERINKYA